jgi:hypothetical protein
MVAVAAGQAAVAIPMRAAAMLVIMVRAVAAAVKAQPTAHREITERKVL